MPCCAVQGSLFPMCGMNLAFDRQLIGPSMYFGLMGDGQPLGRYDDMWAGWCSKVCTHAPGTSHAGSPAVMHALIAAMRQPATRPPSCQQRMLAEQGRGRM